jgi:hypothetical protein
VTVSEDVKRLECAKAASEIRDDLVLKKTIDRLRDCVVQLVKLGFAAHAHAFRIMLQACEQEQKARNSPKRSCARRRQTH